MKTTIASMMTSPARCVEMDDTVQTVEAFMNEHQLSWVPVREPGGALVGTISAADLLQFHAQRKDAASVPAWQICSYKPLAVAPEASVGEVAKTMLDQKAHHVVVKEADRLLGVVSSFDFVREFVAPR